MLSIQQPDPRPVLPRLEALLGPDRADALRLAAARIRDRLAGGTLWHVNSTGAGGGVAETLQMALPLYRDLGVSATWAVINGDADFFTITKRLGVALYGSPGDGGPLGPAERGLYLRTLASARDDLLSRVRPGDIVILHDHQAAGLAEPLLDRVGAVYWRCYVGVDAPTEASEAAWDFLTPLLTGVRELIFCADTLVPARFAARPVQIRPLFTSPFTAKNCELDAATVGHLLARCGLHPEHEAPGPATLRTPVGEVGIRRPPQVIAQERPRPGQPLVTQVSRWDRLKDMHGVLAGVTSHVDDGYLALVGPDTAAIPDDIEQQVWYDRCVEAWQALPPRQRGRVALVCLPMADLTENALLVNAIQRASDVVVQKSLAEGFGLTVTEAMWKSRVVVASAVGGIRTQITDQLDGLLVDDPTDLAAFGRVLRRAVGREVDTQILGKRAHDKVRAEFLPDGEVLSTATMIDEL